MNVDTQAIAFTVNNMKDISCSGISKVLIENDILSTNIHSMEKIKCLNIYVVFSVLLLTEKKRVTLIHSFTIQIVLTKHNKED